MYISYSLGLQIAIILQVGVPQVHELPGVGRNLKNHVAFYISYHLNKEKDVNDLDWATALDYLVNQKGPMSSTGL